MSAIRSFLFVPADDPRKLAKADSCGADALILDLEDSVAPADKPTARQQAAAFLRDRPVAGRTAELWVRIDSLDDLDAIMPAAPDGIMLPKTEGPAEVARLSARLKSTDARVMPLVETPAGVLALRQFAAGTRGRMAALAFGAEDLATALGGPPMFTASGNFAPVFQAARAEMLLVASALGVPAIDTPFTDLQDADGFRASCDASRGEGFGGRLAIHPSQVAVINDVFSPSPAQIDAARRLVDAFEAAGDAGVLRIDGRMADRTHLERAKALLADASR